MSLASSTTFETTAKPEVTDPEKQAYWLYQKGHITNSSPSDLVQKCKVYIGRAVLHLRSPRTLIPYLHRLTYALKPSSLRHESNKHQHRPPLAPPPTAWLNGIRGIAAIIVFNMHYLYAFSDLPSVSFDPSQGHVSPLRLPIVRVLSNGRIPIYIFFAVAGYVTSLKPLQHMQDHSYDKLYSSLSGSFFRRFFRLFLPVMFVTLVTTHLTYLGAFEPIRPYIDEAHVRAAYFPGRCSEKTNTQMESYLAQLKFWKKEMIKLGNMSSIKPAYIKHDGHLWTIAFELRMSFHLWGILLGLSQCRPYVRLCLLVFVGWMYHCWGRWEGPLLVGAAMAQWDVIRGACRQTQEDESRVNTLLMRTPTDADYNDSKLMDAKGSYPGSRLSLMRLSTTDLLRTIHINHSRIRSFAYLFCVYLISYPATATTSPSPLYALLTQAFGIRRENSPKAIGVVLLLLLLTTTPHKASSRWHRVLNSTIPQYLGRHMFWMYLVHGPLLHLFGYMVPHAVWYAIGMGVGSGRETNWASGYALGLVLGWIVNLGMVLWVAEVGTREVDGRIVRLIQWVQGLCFEKGR